MVSHQLQTLLNEANVPAEFTVWLGGAGVVSVEDFVLAARSDKAYIDRELIDVCGLTLNLQGKTAVRKAWKAADNAVTKQEDENRDKAIIKSVLSSTVKAFSL